MRCPDPTCATQLPTAQWDVFEIGAVAEPWDGEAPEVFHWSTVCTGCSRYIAASHLDSDAASTEPTDAWCCPVCGSEAKVLGLNRGPCGAALRCLHGCGALISMGRRP